jgi:hypothetical protein
VPSTLISGEDRTPSTMSPGDMNMSSNRSWKGTHR